MSYATSRPTVPTAMLLAVLVALTAFLAFAALAGAGPIGPYPSGSLTPKDFKIGCLGSGGGLQEHKGPDGVIKKSVCTHNSITTSECDWVKKTCTDMPLEPTSGEVGRVPVDGALLDDAPATQPGFGVVAPATGGVLDRAP
jgi:hypothetical protein